MNDFKPFNLSLAVFLSLLLWLGRAQAVDEAQLEPIRALGALNGIALHCKALQETQRMKRALVANLPRIRQLGELFDYETNKSFMRFMQESATCPSPQDLSLQVDEALKHLEAAYRRQ